MPISRPSSPELVLLGLMLMAASPPDAVDTGDMAIAREGATALERIARARKSAAQISQERAQPSPKMPRPSDALRHRAFDAFKRRKPDAALETRAGKARQTGAQSLARDRDAMAERVRQALGLAPPTVLAVAKAVAPPPIAGWKPVLFVSASIPVVILRSYTAQLEKTGGVLAFRGMPGGLHKVWPMARLSAAILRHDPRCTGPDCAMRDVQLIVDPLLFRQHGVERVPALGLLPGDPTQPYCEREEAGAAAIRASHLVYGDAALSGMLEEYGRLGGGEEIRDAQSRLEKR